MSKWKLKQNMTLNVWMFGDGWSDRKVQRLRACVGNLPFGYFKGHLTMTWSCRPVMSHNVWANPWAFLRHLAKYSPLLSALYKKCLPLFSPPAHDKLRLNSFTQKKILQKKQEMSRGVTARENSPSCLSVSWWKPNHRACSLRASRRSSRLIKDSLESGGSSAELGEFAEKAAPPLKHQCEKSTSVLIHASTACRAPTRRHTFR